MTKIRNLLGCQIFHPNIVPIGWEYESLGERIELAYGRSLPEEHRNLGPVTVYGSNGPVGQHDQCFVQAPGLLVGRKGTVGAVHYSTMDYWPIDTVYYVVALKQDDLKFLYYLLQYLPLDRLNAATGVPGLSRRDAYALMGVFPPKLEQTKIASVLSTLDREIGKVCAGVVNLKSLRVSIFSDDLKDSSSCNVRKALEISYAQALINLKIALMDALFTGQLSVASIQLSERAML